MCSPEEHQEPPPTVANGQQQRPVRLAKLLQHVLQKEPRRNLLEDYTAGPVLGHGAYAAVRLVEDWRTGRLYACKTILKARLLCREDVDDVSREVEMLCLLKAQPRIVQLKATYEDRHAVHLVLEYCAGGDLFQRIVTKGAFSEREAARYFRQMVEAVQLCHSYGIVHRDVKLENFLLSDDSDHAALKLCDLGLSAWIRPGEVLQERAGSAMYIAPEVMQRNCDADGVECDLWSLGVVLYILLSGAPPFHGRTFDPLQPGCLDLERHPWPLISEAAKDVVRRLLQPNPAQRVTTSELLQHPWLAAEGAAPEHPMDSVIIARMRKLHVGKKVKKAAILAAAQHLSFEEIHGVRELCKAYDTDSDGHITLDELRAGIACHSKLVHSKVEQAMQEADAHGSGSINYSEFSAAAANMGLLLEEEALLRSLQDLDKAGSGFLSVDDVAAAIGSVPGVPAARVRDFLKQQHSDDSGLVDYTEFVALLRGGDAGLRRQATLRFKTSLVTC